MHSYTGGDFKLSQCSFAFLRVLGPLDGGGLVTKSCLTPATPWTIACQAPLSMGFSKQEHWSGLPFPSPGDLPNPGNEPGSSALQADSLPTELWAAYHNIHFAAPRIKGPLNYAKSTLPMLYQCGNKVWNDSTSVYNVVSVQFCCSVVSDSLWLHGLQHARLPCPSPTPGAGGLASILSPLLRSTAQKKDPFQDMTAHWQCIWSPKSNDGDAQRE